MIEPNDLYRRMAQEGQELHDKIDRLEAEINRWRILANDTSPKLLQAKADLDARLARCTALDAEIARIESEKAAYRILAELDKASLRERDERISHLCGELAACRSEKQTNWDEGLDEVIAAQIDAHDFDRPIPSKESGMESQYWPSQKDRDEVVRLELVEPRQADTENRMTLEEYFRNELAEGKIDFRLRAYRSGDGVDIYIHPSKRDGATTPNLRVLGNTVRIAPGSSHPDWLVTVEQPMTDAELIAAQAEQITDLAKALREVQDTAAGFKASLSDAKQKQEPT